MRLSKTTIISLWVYLEKWAGSMMSFGFSIYTLTLFGPKEMGLLAIAGSFAMVGNTLVDSGLGSALVQKSSVDANDENRVLTFSVIIATTLFLLFTIISLLFEKSDSPQLGMLLRLSLLGFFPQAIGIVPKARLLRSIDTRSQGLSELSSFALAILIFVYIGKSKLVAIALFPFVKSFVYTLMIILITKWKPRFDFAFKQSKGLFTFGIPMLLVSLINSGSNVLTLLLLKSTLGSSAVGLYSKSKNYTLVPFGIVQGSANRLIFPSVVEKKEVDNTVINKSFLNKTIASSLYIAACGVVFIYGIIDYLVLQFLNEDWVLLADYIKVFSIYGFFYVTLGMLNSILTGSGESSYYLRISVISRVIFLACLYLISSITQLIMVEIGLLIITLILTFFAMKKMRNSVLQELDFKGFHFYICLAIVAGVVVLNNCCIG